MSKPLEQTLKEATKDLLSEESLKVIAEAFEAQVNTTVEAKLNESVKVAVNEALVKQDEEYTAKLEKLLEAIDADHTEKLEKIVARIDENHTAKLVEITEKFSDQYKKDAETFKGQLVDKLSRFLDQHLTEAIPTAQITEAVKNTRATKLLKRIKETVALDEEFITVEIQDALKEGKTQIEESKKETAKLQEQVRVLTEQAQQLRVNLLIEQKTAGLPKEKKDYVVKVLAGKNEKFITENFKHVIDMFEQKQEEEVETLKESATQTAKGIDQPIITEDTETEEENEVSIYMEGLQSRE